MSHISVNETGEIEVDFMAEVKGVAPGQSAVFYEGSDLLGGGFISR
jgi:tRNA-specific 2-thiouridylase